MPAGGTPQSGGFSHLPAVGDHVWVRFLDGEPEKPIWEWANQDQQQITAQILNKYDRQTGEPEERAAWTRFNHTFEITPDTLLISTATGYALQFTAGFANLINGKALLTTPRGHQIEMDDATQALTVNCVEDFYLNVPDEIIVISRSQDLMTIEEVTMTVGTDLTVIVSGDIGFTSAGDTALESAQALSLTAATTLGIDAGTAMDLTYTLLRLGGSSSTEPFVLGTQLVAFLNSLMLYLSTHTHGNGNNGSPTTPPIIPPGAQVQPQTAALVSSTILGS